MFYTEQYQSPFSPEPAVVSIQAAEKSLVAITTRLSIPFDVAF